MNAFTLYVMHSFKHVDPIMDELTAGELAVARFMHDHVVTPCDAGPRQIQVILIMLQRSTEPVTVHPSIHTHVQELGKYAARFRSIDDFEWYSMLKLYGGYLVNNNVHYLYADLPSFKNRIKFAELLDGSCTKRYPVAKLLKTFGVSSDKSLVAAVCRLVDQCTESLNIFEQNWQKTATDLLQEPSLKLLNLPRSVANTLLLVLFDVRYKKIKSADIARALGGPLGLKRDNTSTETGIAKRKK